jgi:hypothetical protein
VVGEYYSQATIVFLDPAKEESARSFFKEIILPEGSIYKMDFVQTKSGKPADGKHTHDGAIIGGTGKYAGMRGTYTLEIAPSGKTATTVLKYWVGQ